jgi:hypothetical protein
VQGKVSKRKNFMSKTIRTPKLAFQLTANSYEDEEIRSERNCDACFSKYISLFVARRRTTSKTTNQ